MKIKPSFIPAIAWFFVLTFLLCLPGTQFPKINWLHIIWFDKWGHLGVFLLLVALWCWAYTGRKQFFGNLKTTFIRVAVISLLYGIVMEMVQHYLIPFRSFDVWDIAADAAGCTGGYLFSSWRYIKK